MNRLRPFILLLVVALAALLAYGFLTIPNAKEADYDGFSAARVAKDIEIISQKHHSVAHPLERAEVCEYLTHRLNELGADTIIQFKYDSLTGPKNKRVAYTFDAVNILAEFAPLTSHNNTISLSDNTTAPTYLILVAHYDSRYPNTQPNRDTTCSHGAADDGYGLGVILETVNQALKYRQSWKQGIKVLFTDAEEVGMMGMKAIWENDRYIFNNVGFIINVEARGTYGPALLFETSPGNKKVMDLYASAAKYPFTYSLTTVVYESMPNATDFTIVKDEIPGINFSTIADINHYHTNLDNFSNISKKSLQHYGAQITPIVKEYLTNAAYTENDYLKSNQNTVNFTIPALGLFNFSKTLYLILNIIIFILFPTVLLFEILRGRVKTKEVLKKTLLVLGTGIGILILGEGIAYLCAKIASARFKLFGIVQGISFDNTVMIASIVIMTIICIIIYLSGRRKRDINSILYGALTLIFILSILLLVAVGENMMFFIPLLCATVAMLLYRLTSLKIWLIAAAALIILHACSFLYIVAMALTLGAFGVVAMLAFFDLMVLIPLLDLYLTSYYKGYP